MSLTKSNIREVPYLILLCTLLAGCVSPMPIQEQLPKLEYANNEKVLISVIDVRKRVKAGKPKNYIGVAHGVFGIPTDWHVKNVLATEDDEKELDLSSWLELRIVNGLNSDGWQSKAIDLDSLPSAKEATNKLSKEDSTWLIMLVLNEWYFSINLNWVSAFNFDTDTDIHVFHVDNGKVLQKNIKERDVIDENASESPQNLILEAYRSQLQQIFNDGELQSVLGQ